MSAKTLTKKGVKDVIVVVDIKEIVPEQVALARENSAVMKNIAEATTVFNVLNISPVMRNIFDSMLP